MEWLTLLDPAGRPGPENMAVDDALLHEAASSGRAFLRLYRWSPPCLSFGRNEPALMRYDRAAIERQGWHVVRRPTGGRAVWHEEEVTYAIAAPIAAFGSLQTSYRTIHERLAAALRTLGASAELAAHNGRSPRPGDGACFAAPVGGEVIVHGRKVVGSAQVRVGSAFLQHGSILLGGSQEKLTAISYRPSAVSSAVSLSEVLDREVTFAEVADAVLATWGGRFTSVPCLSPPASVFADPAWTWRR